MALRHVALALLVALVWGVNFVVIRVGLGHIPPLLLAALRFVIAGLPALFLPRPQLSWAALGAIAATLFVGQFAFLFTGMAVGMPPGLASVTLQIQAFLTILIAAAVLGERPRRRQLAGSAVALTGLGAIAATVGSGAASGVAGGVTVAGLALTLAAALSWATGNVLVRRSSGGVDMLALVSWASVLAAPMLAALSLGIEGPVRIAAAAREASWTGAGALLYIALISTTLGYGLWNHLLKLYPAATVTPFALLVPVVGTATAALTFGERFGPVRLSGMALILVGLGLVVLPLRRTAANAGAKTADVGPI